MLCFLCSRTHQSGFPLEVLTAVTLVQPQRRDYLKASMHFTHLSACVCVCNYTPQYSKCVQHSHTPPTSSAAHIPVLQQDRDACFLFFSCSSGRVPSSAAVDLERHVAACTAGHSLYSRTQPVFLLFVIYYYKYYRQ